MGSLLTIIEKCEEVRRLREEGKAFEEALKIVKGYEESDQTIPSNHTKTFNEIIPPGTNLDNGYIYDIETGETVGEL